jgi:signal transduction histidine kinase
VVAAPCVLQFTQSWWVPWWLHLTCGLVGTAWIMSEPVVFGQTDLAVGVLAVLVADLAATDGAKAGLVSMAGAVTLIVVNWSGDYVGFGELFFGLVVGYMLRWQMRALAAERIARSREHDRATLAERQRVAREVHDLVGHSLSVTMLHVTGARRALTADGDVEEAVAALTDAERIGRQAMADIRRTVSVLATEPAGLQALPGVADLPDLVADSQAAGLDVDWLCEGDASVLSPAAGLGIYRVAQESLANVVKHAPGAPATVQLTVRDGAARLRVTNPVPALVASGSGYGSGDGSGDGSWDGSGDGSGLPGMAWRAEQLDGTVQAGPQGDRWVVELRVPAAGPGEAPGEDPPGTPGPRCPVRRTLS